MGIAVVSIPVSDPDRSRAFYRDTLGLALLRDEAMGPGMRWIQLQPKDGGASLALVTWYEAMKPGGMQGLLIGIADVEAEHARLAAAGLAPSPIEAQPWGRFTMIADPDGNGLILAQLTDGDAFKSR